MTATPKRRARPRPRVRSVAVKRAGSGETPEVFQQEGRHFEASESQVERSRRMLREHAAELVTETLAQAMAAGWQQPSEEALEAIVVGLVAYAKKRAKLDYRSTSDKDAANNGSVYVQRLHDYLAGVRDERSGKASPTEWDALGALICEYARRCVAEAHRRLQGAKAEPEGMEWPPRPSLWDEM